MLTQHCAIENLSVIKSKGEDDIISGQIPNLFGPIGPAAQRAAKTVVWANILKNGKNLGRKYFEPGTTIA